MNIKDILLKWKDKFKVMPRQKQITIVVVAAIIAVWVGSGLFSGDEHKGHKTSQSREKEIKYWTCSMHPQIKLPKPGQCPICAMDLIPVYKDAGQAGDEGGTVSLSLSSTARQLAEVETAEVGYTTVSNEVRLVGKVDYDESRLSYISAWVPGRIDRLFVDFTGTRVRKGDHLIKLYSPELISAQEEYIQAIKNWNDTKNSELSVMRDTAQSTLKSSQEKLRLLGISDEQVKDIAERKIIQEHLTITSPVTGTVILKNGFNGQYVKTGDKIYTIADLSRVWVYIEAYESDIQWLHYGQHVRVEAEAYPGKVFHGKIAFIDPFVEEKTRTIKLRVNVENENNRLKPGMFVRAYIKAELGEGGDIYERELAGKWICPMHPEIVKDDKGVCDICEMDLIPTKEFGFAEQPLKENRVLVIPNTAPLITGKRAIVYVEKSNTEGMNLYEGREVVLGPRAGDQYVVLSGLKQGEQVVTKGNFKIDSALQIQAKPSMMNPGGYYSEKDNVVSQSLGSTSQGAEILTEAIRYYLKAAKALSADDPHAAVAELEAFRNQLEQVLITQKLSDSKDGLTVQINSMIQALQTIEHNLDALRKTFGDVSNILKDVLQQYEYKEELTLYLNYCPMAFNNQGGYWLQDVEPISNPYFGAKMLKCGDMKKTFGRKIMEAEPKGSIGHQH